MQFGYYFIPDWILVILFQVFLIAGAIWLVASALNACVVFWYNLKEGREGRWTVSSEK